MNLHTKRSWIKKSCISRSRLLGTSVRGFRFAVYWDTAVRHLRLLLRLFVNVRLQIEPEEQQEHVGVLGNNDGHCELRVVALSEQQLHRVGDDHCKLDLQMEENISLNLTKETHCKIYFS